MFPSHPKLDYRSPLVYDTKELPRGPGMMRELHRSVLAPADFGVGMIGVPEGSNVEIDLTLESVIEGVLVRGTAEVSLLGECSRCLDEITDQQTYDLEEMYFYPEKSEDKEDSLIIEDLIDLEIALRTGVILELPFMPLCKEDCLGLCAECGTNLNQCSDHSHMAKADPRWDKLAIFKSENTN